MIDPDGSPDYRRRWRNQVRAPGQGVLLLVSVFGLVLVAAGMVFAKRSYDDREAAAHAQLLRAASVGAEVIDQYFTSRVAVLGTVYQSVLAVDATDVPSLLQRASHPGLGFSHGVGWLHPDGRIRHAGGIDPALLGDPLARSAGDGPHVSDATTHPAGSSVVLVSVPAPPADDGQGTLVGVVAIEDVVASLPLATRAAGEIFALDGGGSLIVERGLATLKPAPRVSMMLPERSATGQGVTGTPDRIVAVAAAAVPRWHFIVERNRAAVLSGDRMRLWTEFGILLTLGSIGGVAALYTRWRMDDRHRFLMRVGRELAAMEDLTESLSKAVSSDAVIRDGLAAFDRHFGTGAAVVAVVDDDGESFQLAARRGDDALLRGALSVDAPSVFADARVAEGVLVSDGSAVELAAGSDHPSLDEFGISGVLVSQFSSAATEGSVAVVLREGYPISHEDLRLFEAMVRVFGEALSRASAGDRARLAARTFQRAFRPHDALPPTVMVQRSHAYLPASDTDLIGGDWYDLLLLPGGRLGFVIGDVVGKGIPAAAVMAQIRGTLRALMEALPTTTSMLSRLDALAREISGGLGCTISVAIFDPSSGRLEVTSAGHVPPLILRGGHVEMLDARGVPLGMRSSTGRRTSTVWLGESDTLVLYTDGLVERRGESIDEGIGRLRAALMRHGEHPVHALVNALLDACRYDAERSDDCAIVCVRPVGSTPPVFSVVLPGHSRTVRDLWHDLRGWLRSRHLTDEGENELLIVVCAVVRGLATLEPSMDIGVEVVGDGDGVMATVFSGDPRRSDLRWGDLGPWTAHIVAASRVSSVIEPTPTGPIVRLSV